MPPFDLADYLDKTARGEPNGDKPARKKASKQRPEDVFHVQVAKYLRRVIAHEGYISRDRVVWFSVEMRNAGSATVSRNGRLINVEGNKRKARGCVAGIADVHIHWPGGVVWLELKAARGSLSDEQKRLHEAMRQAGTFVFVCKTLDEVEAALETAGVPTRGHIAA